MGIMWTIVYLDMVLLAEEKPDEEDVRLPSPGLGIILIFPGIIFCIFGIISIIRMMVTWREG